MTPYYQNNKVTLWLCDTAEFLTLNMQQGLLLTDPPYGLDKRWKRSWHGNNGQSRLWTGEQQVWDSDLQWGNLKLAVERSKSAIVWGGNHYPLPPSRCWLVWDKKQDNRASDCELAWTDLKAGHRVFRMSRIDAYWNKRVFRKQHPCEKPYQLAEFCLRFSDLDFVVDPWCGTGNFLVAAQHAGRKAAGCDCNEQYLEVAAKRLELAADQIGVQLR